MYLIVGPIYALYLQKSVRHRRMSIAEGREAGWLQDTQASLQKKRPPSRTAQRSASTERLQWPQQ